MEHVGFMGPNCQAKEFLAHREPANKALQNTMQMFHRRISGDPGKWCDAVVSMGNNLGINALCDGMVCRFGVTHNSFGDNSSACTFKINGVQACPSGDHFVTDSRLHWLAVEKFAHSHWHCIQKHWAHWPV